MELIRTLSQLVNCLRSSCIRRRVAVVCPNDPHTEYVIIRSLREEIAEYLLVVDADHKEMAYSLRSASPDFVRIYEAPTPDDAAALAVELVRTGEADILMKGSLNTCYMSSQATGSCLFSSEEQEVFRSFQDVNQGIRQKHIHR